MWWSKPACQHRIFSAGLGHPAQWPAKNVFLASLTGLIIHGHITIFYLFFVWVNTEENISNIKGSPKGNPRHTGSIQLVPKS